MSLNGTGKSGATWATILDSKNDVGGPHSVEAEGRVLKANI